MKKQSLVKATFILGFAGMFAKFLGLFFRWPLQMIMGDEGVGYYQMSYPLYLCFISVASGIPVAVSKLVSEYNAVGNNKKVVQVLKEAMELMFVLGVGFTAICLIFSKQMVYLFRWDEKSYYAFICMLIAPIFIAIMSPLRGFFQGLQNMTPTAISQVLEQIGRVVVGVGLAVVLLPKGLEYAAGGAALGAAAGGMAGGAYLIAKYRKARREFYIGKVENDSSVMQGVIHTAIPISVGAAVGSIMALIDSMLVPRKLLEAGFTSRQATIMYGQLSAKASILVNVPLTLSMALCASLVPIIAESYSLKKSNELKSKIDMSLKISMVIGLPSFMGLYMLAQPILNLIFPGQSQGCKILQYLAISIPFIIISQTSTSILQGVGTVYKPVINLAVGCAVKVIVTYMLVSIPEINIYGAVLGSILGYVSAAILNVICVKKTLKIHMNFYDILVKPAIASIIMIIPVVFIYINVYNYTVSSRLACLIAVFAGVAIYGAAIFVLGIFKYRYVKERLIRR